MRRDVRSCKKRNYRYLSEAELTVNEIVDKFEISRPAISKHLKILDECGIVSFTQKGRERFCHINHQKLIPAFLWVEKYNEQWEERISSLEDYVNQLKTKDE